MSLRTNSIKARTNIQNYIMEHFYPEGYEHFIDGEDFSSFKDVASFIYKIFKLETKFSYKVLEGEKFVDWCSGLPSVLDTCYYYNRSAKEDIKGIFEYTDEAMTKFSEHSCEERLTISIYNEIKKAIN